MFVNNECLLEEKKLSNLQSVSMADGRYAAVTCQGRIVIPALDYIFDNVLCVPSLDNNLLSIRLVSVCNFRIRNVIF